MNVSELRAIDFRQGPYHVESTSSRLITEVKQRWARLVLGWVTAWESRVPLASNFFEKYCIKNKYLFNQFILVYGIFLVCYVPRVTARCVNSFSKCT